MKKRKDFKPFGQAVCRELDRRGLNVCDLAQMLEDYTGRFVCEGFLRKRLASKSPRWLVEAIREVLNMKQ